MRVSTGAFWGLVLAAVICSATQDAAEDAFLKSVLYFEPNSRLEQLGNLSDSEISLARTFFSPKHKEAADLIKGWMAESGLESWTDAIGNVHGVLTGSNKSLSEIVVGSHYDTVLDAGKFDGPLGIIAAISAAKALVLQKLSQQDGGLEGAGVVETAAGEYLVPVSAAKGLFPRTLRVVAFTDEEGVRFQSTFLGSRAMVGTLVSHGMLATQDKQGKSLEEVLQAESGLEDVAAALTWMALPAGSLREYVEVHIEQGPVLERAGLRLGVVGAIAGQTRLRLFITGTQGHAGTVPMVGREDALTAAAEVVLLVESHCGGGPTNSGNPVSSSMLVCTVGELHVWPGASNVIPGNTDLSLDVRSSSDDERRQVVAALTAQIQDICKRRHVACELAVTHDAAAVHSDPDTVAALEAAIRESQVLLPDVLDSDPAAESVPHPGCSSEGENGQCIWDEVKGGNVEVPVLVSGAGHDAMAIAEVAKVAMMFVRCRGGVSHSPLEHASRNDVAASTTALLTYLQQRLQL